MGRVAAKACVLLALLCLTTVASADETPRARAARYYAAGLETPLLELRRGVMLLDQCTTRMRRACSREQRELAARHRTLALLDALTLFPPPSESAPDAKTPRELKDGMAAAGAALLRTAGEYNRLLIARYGAVLRACHADDDASQRESLATLTAIELRQFQALDGADLDAAVHEIADAEARATEAWRKTPPTDCDALLTQGQLLMEMLNAKLEPWTRQERRMAEAYRPFDFDAELKRKPDPALTREVTISVAGNFITVMATELQLTVFPQTAPRIKAIADAEGIHEAG